MGLPQNRRALVRELRRRIEAKYTRLEREGVFREPISFGSPRDTNPLPFTRRRDRGDDATARAVEGRRRV